MIAMMMNDYSELETNPKLKYNGLVFPATNEIVALSVKNNRFI